MRTFILCSCACTSIGWDIYGNFIVCNSPYFHLKSFDGKIVEYRYCLLVLSQDEHGGEKIMETESEAPKDNASAEENDTVVVRIEAIFLL